MAISPIITKDELRALIQDRKNDLEVSQLPYKEQQDITNDPAHPFREYVSEREKNIQQGLKEHGLHEHDIDEPEWDLD